MRRLLALTIVALVMASSCGGDGDGDGVATLQDDATGVTNRDLTLAIPPEGLALAVLAALGIGALAGLYPAIRASRIPPAEAVRR